MDLARLHRGVPFAKGRVLLPVLFFATSFTTSSLRAQSLPSGATLPVRLLHTLNSAKDRPGKIFAVETTQAVPLLGNQVIRKGTKIIGHIVAAQASDDLSRLTVHFDKLVDASGKGVPITLGLRAMASFIAVRDAETPTNDADMGPSSWTTQQIGGDVVYRGGGPVTTSWGEVVGKPVSDGVMARLVGPRYSAHPNNLHCASSDTPHALGLFASNACGLYGLSRWTLERAGFTQPKGDITLSSSTKSLKVGSGAALLLQVVGPE